MKKDYFDTLINDLVDTLDALYNIGYTETDAAYNCKSWYQSFETILKPYFEGYADRVDTVYTLIKTYNQISEYYKERKELEEKAAELAFLENFPEYTEADAIEIAKRTSTQDLKNYIGM